MVIWSWDAPRLTLWFTLNKNQTYVTRWSKESKQSLPICYLLIQKKMNGNFDYHIPGSDFKRITHILKYQHEAVLYLGLKCLDLDLWSIRVKYWPLQTGQHSPSVLSIYGHMVTLWHDSCLQNVSPRLQVHLTHLSGLQLWPSRYSFSVPVSSVRQLRSVSTKQRKGKSFTMMIISTFLR